MLSLRVGGFEFAHSGFMPQFNPTEHWPDDTDDDEVTDLTVLADSPLQEKEHARHNCRPLPRGPVTGVV